MQTRAAFSLIELVLVVSIIAVIGAIALPRLSSVAERAPKAAFEADLIILQSALERYLIEHQGTPPTEAQFVLQLTQFTDIDGAVSAVKTTSHIYGPYLRRMPQSYIAPATGDPVFVSDGSSPDEKSVIDPDSGEDTGWRFSPVTGQVRVIARDVSIDGAGEDFKIKQ
ncbi:MAG: type II secretion system protein [Phycisphaeraceae bacterium]